MRREKDDEVEEVSHTAQENFKIPQKGNLERLLKPGKRESCGKEKERLCTRISATHNSGRTLPLRE